LHEVDILGISERLAKQELVDGCPAAEDLPLRLTLVPGKEVLRAFRERVHATLGLSLSDARIVDAIRVAEIPDDLIGLLHELDTFRQASA
jgi:hypothetical protein